VAVRCGPWPATVVCDSRTTALGLSLVYEKKVDLCCCNLVRRVTTPAVRHENVGLVTGNAHQFSARTKGYCFVWQRVEYLLSTERQVALIPAERTGTNKRESRILQKSSTLYFPRGVLHTIASLQKETRNRLIQ
jgi:hypothetical protein